MDVYDNLHLPGCQNQQTHILRGPPVQKRTRHLRAVSVCGTVVEGRNYLFIFGLGSIVTHRVHKLQRRGVEVLVRDIFVYRYLVDEGRSHTHKNNEVLAARGLCG